MKLKLEKAKLDLFLSTWDEMYFSDDDKDKANKLVSAAKSGEITWQDANNGVNNIRHGYGYDGGTDGSKYTAWTDTSTSGATSTSPTWLKNAQNASSSATDAYSAYTNASPFTYSNQSQYDSVLDSILNPTAFTYDYTTDPSYSAYKKEYTREGQRATADTLGQAAAMTGGQLSSNAVNAANQAGDYYSAQLADKIPELYNAAYSRYQDERSDLYNQLSALNTDRSNEYNTYTDNLSRLYNSANLGSSLASNDYNIYADIDDTNYNRNQDTESKTLSSAQTLAETTGDYSQLGEYYGWTDAQVKAAEAAWKKANSGSGSGTTKTYSNSDKVTYDNGIGTGSQTYESVKRYANQVLAAQKRLTGNTETALNNTVTALEKQGYDTDVIASILEDLGY